ncbi:hypothetical protein VPNG_07927 [Cytospora leucostoma]|uniref:Uncharacterized protein n=1 Tax=Cytospora leucostoma TaxID=1230097 RepID=A0A423WAT3_9PEZI|nr:hypothetical protein VPNG_07927 [Cytospora leucostoma]
MATSPAGKLSFDRISKDNQALTDEVQALVQSSQNSTLSCEDVQEGPDETRLKWLLERLYISISDFGNYSDSTDTPDEEKIAAWESFLDPIGALAHVKPHGHMMAARMVLYLTNAFLGNSHLSSTFPKTDSSVKPVSLRLSFITALDDKLLSHLTYLWAHSDNRETFPWVFTEHLIHDCRRDRECCEDVNPELSCGSWHGRRRSDRLKVARITRPSDLTPENGVSRRRRWTRAQGDTTDYRIHPDASHWHFETPYPGSPPLLMWQEIRSDGPIRESYHYFLVDEHSSRGHQRDWPALRRSRQFILDTRRIAAINLAKDIRRLAEIAMARSPLPMELQIEVLSYLGDMPTEHPYLSKLDLAAVYQPFPVLGESCTGCADRRKDARRAAAGMIKATCPHNSIAIWSLPLRAFHTFHRDDLGTGSLCLDTDCSGHHRDASWSGKSRAVVQGVREYLNEIVERRCGPGTTVNDIGLGPVLPVRLPTEEEDNARKRRLFTVFFGTNSEISGDVEREDIQQETQWTGIGGIVDVMLHSRTLLGLHASGSTSTSLHWMLGRTAQEEKEGRSALIRDHPNCYHCESF